MEKRFPELTVRENILLPLRLNRQKEENGLLEEIAEKLGIQDKLRSYPKQLSGEQKQRTAIGRAIIHKPKLLLADEPTGNLDTGSGEEVMRILSGYAKKYHVTLLMVTHDLEMADRMERKIII